MSGEPWDDFGHPLEIFTLNFSRWFYTGTELNRRSPHPKGAAVTGHHEV